MTHRFATLEPSLRAPLLAAAAAFLFVIVPGEVDPRLTGQRMGHAVEHLRHVHRDGLSAAMLPALRSGDAVALNEIFERAVGFDEDIRTRRRAVATRANAPAHQGIPGLAWEVTRDGGVVRAWRPLTDETQAVEATLLGHRDTPGLRE